MDLRIITVVGGTQAYLNPEGFYNEKVDYIFEYTTKDNINKFFNAVNNGETILIDGIRSRILSYKTTEQKEEMNICYRTEAQRRNTGMNTHILAIGLQPLWNLEPAVRRFVIFASGGELKE